MSDIITYTYKLVLKDGEYTTSFIIENDQIMLNTPTMIGLVIGEHNGYINTIYHGKWQGYQSINVFLTRKICNHEICLLLGKSDEFRDKYFKGLYEWIKKLIEIGFYKYVQMNVEGKRIYPDSFEYIYDPDKINDYPDKEFDIQKEDINKPVENKKEDTVEYKKKEHDFSPETIRDNYTCRICKKCGVRQYFGRDYTSINYPDWDNISPVCSEILL